MTPPVSTLNRVASKLGRDITIDDVLCHATGACPFLIAGWREYDPPTGGTGRVAVNGLGGGIVVFDDHPHYVLEVQR